MYRVEVQGLVGIRSENMGKEACVQTSQEQVGVGHGQGSAAAVAARSRVRTGRGRAYLEASVLEGQDGAAARRHRIDAQHRRAQTHAGEHAILSPFERPRIESDIGGGAAHVEADERI